MSLDNEVLVSACIGYEFAYRQRVGGYPLCQRDWGAASSETGSGFFRSHSNTLLRLRRFAGRTATPGTGS